MDNTHPLRRALLEWRAWQIMLLHYELDPESEPTDEELAEAKEMESESFIILMDQVRQVEAAE